ncbi:MAG TPA: lipocalin-like domain-containing protein [Chitinophagaceae bacterium]|nr:lipocalin-like domain-containing protein [Chitinophagaceae bacterium]
MSSPILSRPSEKLAQDIQGVWWLLSREDWTTAGERRIDPVLGADPIGILAYAKNKFTAQFMKRDRTSGSVNDLFSTSQNNTAAFNGYDAYFGNYAVDEQTGQVSHSIVGSVVATNIGTTVLRNLWVDGNQLTIQLQTTTAEGEPVTRTLIWKRIS